MMRIILLLIAVIHGLIHLLGFVKAFSLANVGQLTGTISKPAGLFWILATILFLTATILYIAKNNLWWMAGIAAIILSQILITLSWSDAKFGTIANIILAIPIIITLIES